MNTRTKLTKAIEQLNLSSSLISEQPYVKGLNMFTVEQEPIFRIKTDEIRFTLVNYSDLDLDILNVKLVEENHVNSFRSDELLLSNLSLIDGPRDLEFPYSVNELNSGDCINRIEWLATNQARNRKRFKVRIVYLMNGRGKSAHSNPTKYRFLVVARFRNQMIESQFYTDKFCLLQDTDGQEIGQNDSAVLRPPHCEHTAERRPCANVLPIDLMQTNQTTGSNSTLNQQPERLLKSEASHTDRYDELNSSDDPYSLASTSTNPHGYSGRRNADRFNSPEHPSRSKAAGELDGFDQATSRDKENDDEIRVKLDYCIRKISAKFNQKNDKSFGSFQFNEIERNVLKERLVHSGNFHLPVDQLLNKELDYHCFSFTTYFKYALLCYHNLIDERLRPQIYGFLNRARVAQLLSGAPEGSYLITFNQSVLSTLTLNYLEHNQLVELLFFEPNLRSDGLNAYIEANKQHLKHPILKSRF